MQKETWLYKNKIITVQHVTSSRMKITCYGAVRSLSEGSFVHIKQAPHHWMLNCLQPSSSHLT